MKYLEGFLTAMLAVAAFVAIRFAIETKDEIDKLKSKFNYLEHRCDSAANVNDDQWRHIYDIRKKTKIEDIENLRSGLLNCVNGWYLATP